MKNQKRGKNILKTICILLVSLIVLMIIYFCLLYFVLLTPKKNFNKMINIVFDKMSNIISKTSSDELISSINKGNIKINSNLEKYNNISNYEIEYDIENDRKNNSTLIDLKLGDEEEDLKGTFYYDNNMLYVDFPYIISSMIKIPLDEYGIKTKNKIITYTKEDINYLTNFIKNSLINNISKNNLKNKVSKFHIISTYNIDKNELSNLLENIIKDLKNDDKSMKIINDKFNINENLLNNYKNKIIKEFEDNYKYLEINLYISFIFKFDKIEINNKYYNLELLINKDKNELNINSNEEQVLKSKFNKDSINIFFNRNSKIIKTDFKIDTSKDELNLDGVFSYSTIDNKYINLDLSLSTLLNEKISSFDISNAKSFSQFTSKDLKSVYKIIDIINKYIELFTGDNSSVINLKK